MSRKHISQRILYGLMLMMAGFALAVAATDVLAQDTPAEDPTQTMEPTATPQPSVTPTSQPTATPTIIVTTAPPRQAENTPPPPRLTVSGSEPSHVVSGQGGTLSVFGRNFTQTSVVRLIGVGVLETTFINSGALRATLPGSMTPGSYAIEVSDPATGSGASPQSLNVLPPPLPTQEPQAPPSPLPGEPSLVGRNFSATPQITRPGGTVNLTFEVVNLGNRTAEGVSVSVDSNGGFVPSNGQATALLPNIPPGGSAMVNLTVITAASIAAGPTTIPLTMNYRDFSGSNYSSSTALGITVEDVVAVPQITLARYMTVPNPVIPGQPVTVTVLLTNTGTSSAEQALLRLPNDGALLAGSQGSSFPLGNIGAGETVSLELPLILSAEAKAGPQPQMFNISYLQNGEPQQETASITLEVARVNQPQPLLLLDSYETGHDVLAPGETFTLTMALRNVGDVDASSLLVTFGSVETPSGGGNPNGPGSGGTVTTPSSTFAPLGSGGTVYLGTVEANDGAATLQQDFIVSGSVQSGVYSLPITLRYQTPEGEAVREELNASLVVVVPPRLQIELLSTLMETVNVGEPVFVELEIGNTGSNTANLTTLVVSAVNGEVVEGAQTSLNPLARDSSTNTSAVIIPQDEGPMTITVTLNYRDDLNRLGEVVETFETMVMMPPPPPNYEPEFPFEPETPVQEEDSNILGRFIMGLLGLGS